MVDLRQTPDYASYIQKIGWIVERIDGVNYFIKKFPLISFIKIQRPKKINYKIIESLSKKYKAFKIVAEPKTPKQIKKLTRLGFKPSKPPFLPSKTIHIDLTQPQEKLLSEMHHKTRYNIKKSQSLNVKCQKSEDINLFAEFWQKCALRQRGMFLSQKKEIIELYKAFGKRAHILVTTQENPWPKNLRYFRSKLLSGILMVCTKDIAYYMYAASSDHGKKLFAPTLNVWEAIKLSKKLGCKIFDFEGIYDDRFPLKSWIGFTRFKKSFGGKEIEYPGAYAKLRFPFGL